MADYINGVALGLLLFCILSFNSLVQYVEIVKIRDKFTRIKVKVIERSKIPNSEYSTEIFVAYEYNGVYYKKRYQTYSKEDEVTLLIEPGNGDNSYMLHDLLADLHFYKGRIIGYFLVCNFISVIKTFLYISLIIIVFVLNLFT